MSNLLLLGFDSISSLCEHQKIICQLLQEEERALDIALINENFTKAFEENKRSSSVGLLESALKLCYSVSSQFIFKKYGSPVFPFVNVLIYPMCRLELSAYNQIYTISEDATRILGHTAEAVIVKRSSDTSDNVSRFLDSMSLSEQLYSVQADVGSNFKDSYDVVVLGGTFDHLHAGHKILLTISGWLASRQVTVGVSTDDLLKNKKYANMLESLDCRQGSVKDFMSLVCNHVIIEVRLNLLR